MLNFKKISLIIISNFSNFLFIINLILLKNIYIFLYSFKFISIKTILLFNAIKIENIIIF